MDVKKNLEYLDHAEITVIKTPLFSTGYKFQDWSTNFRTARNFAASANTYTKVDTSISKLKTVGFFAAIDLVPVLTTTPYVARTLAARKKPMQCG